MYCEKCGAELKENAKFCGKCGSSIFGSEVSLSSNISKETYGNRDGNLKDIIYSSNGVISILKTYIKKPITIFEEFKDKDVFRSSLALGILLPIIYGILFILFTSVLVKGLIKNVMNTPNLMANFGLISKEEAFEATMEMQGGVEFFRFEQQLKSLIDNTQVFKYSSIFLLSLIVITIIIVAIINMIMLNKELNMQSIIFVVTVSYIPFIIAFIIQIIIGFFNINLSMIMIPTGIVLSTVTLFKGLSQYSNQSIDRIFLSIGMIIVLIYLMVSFLVNQITITVMSKFGYMLNWFEMMF